MFFVLPIGWRKPEKLLVLYSIVVLHTYSSSLWRFSETLKPVVCTQMVVANSTCQHFSGNWHLSHFLLFYPSGCCRPIQVTVVFSCTSLVGVEVGHIPLKVGGVETSFGSAGFIRRSNLPGVLRWHQRWGWVGVYLVQQDWGQDAL